MKEQTCWNGKCLCFGPLTILIFFIIRYSFVYTNFHGFLENYPKTAVANKHVLSRFPGGDWPPGFLDYTYQYFRHPGGTNIEGMPDKFLTEHKDLQEKGMSPEKTLRTYVGSKIDAFGVKIKAAINNDINPKVRLYSLHHNST